LAEIVRKVACTNREHSKWWSVCPLTADSYAVRVVVAIPRSRVVRSIAGFYSG